MKLRTLEDAKLEGATVLYRAPYDIDVEESPEGLRVSDDSRIRATLPTLQYLLEKNCKIVILTWVGRPDGAVVEKLRTGPHAKKLSELLGRPVAKTNDCVGPETEQAIREMRPRDVLMLENVRFHKEETDDEDIFAAELCRGKDIVVFDGFPQAMRIHASTTGILRHLPSVAGSYLLREVEMLSNLLENPPRPFTAIIGGAKISDKVDAVNNLLRMTDKILVVGAVANVFHRALGRELGASFVEDVFVDAKRREKRDWVLYARDMIERYGDRIVCPKDAVISNGAEVRVIAMDKEKCPEGWSILDIGPEASKDLSEIIRNSSTVFLAGPVGKYEDSRFANGSKTVIDAMREVRGTTVLAGGNTIDMAKRFGDLARYSHVSLAAGATLDFLAGKKLPVLELLMR